MKLAYGIISTAAIGKRFAGAVRETGGLIEAVASRSLKKAQQFAEENNIPGAYGSYEELYQDERINVVYISTVNSEHYKEIMQALHYGKHVLCEKPLVLKEQHAREVFEYAKNHNLFVMEMQKSIFLPVTQLIREYIQNKKLGKLHQVDMSASFPSPAAEWMHDPGQGGVVYGSASYTFEYLDYLLEPRETTMQALVTREASQTIDSVSINLKLDEVLVSSRISMRAPADSFAVFYFEFGSIRVKEYWKAGKCEIHTNDGVEAIDYTTKYEMKYELDHVMDCISKGMIQSPVMPAERTIRCCHLVDRIIELSQY